MMNNQKKIFQMVAAILVACVIWMVVDYDRSETVANRPTKIVENVPVEFVGESTMLASRGLMRIADEEAPVVRLELRGKRWDLAKLDAKALKVQVDLSSVTAVGSESLTYKVIYPDNNSARVISVVDATPSAISVNIGQLYRKPVDIKANVEGSVAPGYIAGNLQFEPSQLELWGKQSEVMLVSYAKVTLNVSDVNSTVVELLDYELYDHNDRLIDNPNIHANTDQIQVTMPVEMQKELPLKVILEETEGIRLANVECTINPVSVQATGDAGILGSVDSLLLGTITLGELTGDKTFSFPVKLDGCEISDGITEAIVQVRFKDLTKREIITSNLQYENAPEGKTISILSTALTVSLRGTEADLTAILPEHITVVADLSQVENASGNYTVPARVTVNTGADVGILGTYQIKVSIEEPPAEEPEVPVSENDEETE